MPEAEGSGTQACGLALWRCWLPTVLGAPVVLTLGHGGIQCSFTMRTAASPEQGSAQAALAGPNDPLVTLLSAVCSWKSWPVLCVHEAPPILGSSWRTKLKILKLRQLLWLGPIYELPVEACCFKGRANPNWFRKSQGQGVNIIFSLLLVVHAVFAVGGEMKARILNNPFIKITGVEGKSIRQTATYIHCCWDSYYLLYSSGCFGQRHAWKALMKCKWVIHI